MARGHDSTWTPERLAELEADWHADLSLAELARKNGCHGDTIRNRAKELGLPERPGMTKVVSGPARTKQYREGTFSAQDELRAAASITASAILIERIQQGIDRGTLRSPPRPAAPSPTVFLRPTYVPAASDYSRTGSSCALA